MRQPPGLVKHRQDTHIGAIFLAVALLGCAGSSAGDRAAREALAAEANELAAALAAEAVAPEADLLRVRLAFGSRADLDLYVTDPAQETAYFANSPTKLGAELAEDVRCGAPAPRIETIALASPPPGRYRVGVDYPEACSRDRGPVAFVVYLEAGGRRMSRRGSIAPGEFLAIVMEVDVE
jgi:hypothetical protein